jgi:pimeloyl-ACP methyl ester carboxylesterase
VCKEEVLVFKKFGENNKKVVILFHGGGMSWWMWKKHIDMLKNEYRVITPIIDGHGENADIVFTTIEDYAQKVIDYINKEHSGKVYALGGLSIGAQIVVEILAKASDITDYALIESALVYKMESKATKIFIKASCALMGGLIKLKWFSRMQAKSLMLPEEMFDVYYQDSKKMTKESLRNMLESNSNYPMPESVKDANVKALVAVGEKEIQIMRESSALLDNTLKDSRLVVLDGYSHGELSEKHPDEYVKLFMELVDG